MRTLVEDAGLLAWYINICRAHPLGVVLPSIAGRICGVGRGTLAQAVKRGRLRVLRYRRGRQRALTFFPLTDVLEWQATRRGSRVMPHDWDAYLRTWFRVEDRSIVATGGVASCEQCGMAAPLDDLGLRVATPQELAAAHKLLEGPS